MVYTLLDHEMTECFTAKFLTFWSIRVHTIENCLRFVFYNNMEKIRAELALFSVVNARVASDVIFIVCTLKDNSYEQISVR